MHGEHERRGHGGEQQVGALVVDPVPVRAAPAQGKDPVGDARGGRLGPVAHGGDVRDEADVPKQQRHGEVGRDGEHVPQQGAAEVGPQPHLVRERERPVDDPHATDVNGGEQQGADDREDGHGLGRSVDRGPPLLPEQEQHGGDERPRVTDADPEHEVDDGPAPAHGDVQTPGAGALPKQVAQGDAQDAEHTEGEQEEDPPGLGHGLDGADHGVRDLGEGRVALHQAVATRQGIDGIALLDLEGCFRHGAHTSSGWGLRMRAR